MVDQNEIAQRVGYIASTLQAGKPGGKNVLTEVAEALMTPDEDIYTDAIMEIKLGEKIVAGDKIAREIVRSSAPILNIDHLLAKALVSQVDEAVVFVATNSAKRIQRYAMIVGDGLYIAEGSPFFDPRESENLIKATNMTPAKLLEERALMLEQAVSAAHLRKTSIEASCVGERALTVESGHTFAALIAGSVFDGKDRMDQYVSEVMGESTVLTPHTPHNVKAEQSMNYERFAVQKELTTPNLYQARAPLVGTAKIVPLEQAAEIGWALGIETSTVTFDGIYPKLPRAHVYGLESAAPGAAAIYQTLHPDESRIASMTS